MLGRTFGILCLFVYIRPIVFLTWNHSLLCMMYEDDRSVLNMKIIVPSFITLIDLREVGQVGENI